MIEALHTFKNTTVVLIDGCSSEDEILRDLLQVCSFLPTESVLLRQSPQNMINAIHSAMQSVNEAVQTLCSTYCRLGV